MEIDLRFLEIRSVFRENFLFSNEKTYRIVLSNFVDYSGQGAEIIL